MTGADAMWDAMASAAIRQHGRDPRKLRKVIAGYQAELLFASPEARAGLQHVLAQLNARLEQLPPPAPEAPRGPDAK